MYRKTYALDTRGMDQERVKDFLVTMFQALGVGPGRNTAMLASLDMRAIDAFRFVLGAPDVWLTMDRQRFAEAVFAVSFDCSMAHAHGQWLEGGAWRPINPRSHDALATARLDVEFMDSFGLSAAAWDDAFRMQGFIARSAKGIDSVADRIRAVVGLSMLGFADPVQFFTRR